MAEDIIKTALERFKLCEDAEYRLRQKGLDDDRFYAGEQWDSRVKLDRETGNNPRPCLTINLLPQKVKQVTNDARQNMPAIKIAPIEDSDKEVAEVFEGMVRHIDVASDSAVAYDTALESAVRKGWGFFRVVTEYEDDESFNQVIRIRPIKNAFTVYVDPTATRHDYSDARFMFITQDLRREELSADQISEFGVETAGDRTPSWATKDTVRIAEYWTVEEQEVTLYLLQDGTVTDKLVDGMPYVNERKTTRKKVI